MQKDTKNRLGKRHTKESIDKIRIHRRGKCCGEEHHNWNNGSSFGKYCPKFNKSLKEDVRIRDNRICQLCGKTEFENCEKLCVHHIHYDKQNCYPDLVCLCRSCNIEVNTNRSHFESLFMNNLNDRQLLFWTRRREKQQ